MKKIVKDMRLSVDKAADIRRLLFNFSNACGGRAYAVETAHREVNLTHYEDWSFSPEGEEFIEGMGEEVLFQYSTEWRSMRISYKKKIMFDFLGEATEIETDKKQEFTVFCSPFAD